MPGFAANITGQRVDWLVHLQARAERFHLQYPPRNVGLVTRHGSLPYPLLLCQSGCLASWLVIRRIVNFGFVVKPLRGEVIQNRHVVVMVGVERIMNS